MTSVECYKAYLALKRHFTSDYDYFKYNGKTSASSKSFDTRKDKIFFEKLAKHKDPMGILIANLIDDPKLWIRDITSSLGEARYAEWTKRNQSLTYIVSNDLKNFDPVFDHNFTVENNEFPKILKLYLGNKISLETLIIVTDIVGCISYWEKKIGADPIWCEIHHRIKKCRPFIKYDVKKMKSAILKTFEGN